MRKRRRARKEKKSARPENTSLGHNGKQKKMLAKKKRRSARTETTSSTNGSAFSLI